MSVELVAMIDVVSFQPTSQSSSQTVTSWLSPSFLYLPSQDSVAEFIVTVSIKFLRNCEDYLHVIKLLTLSVFPHV